MQFFNARFSTARLSKRSILLVTCLVLSAGTSSQTLAASKSKPKPSPQAAAASFSVFNSCEKFLAYVRPIALAEVGPYGFGYSGGGPVPVPEFAPTTAAAAAPVAAPVSDGSSTKASGTSTTNTQEAGVDEGDIVETDGRYVYTALNNRLLVTDTQTGKLITSIATPGNNGGAQMILDGKRLAVFSSLYTNLGGETVVTVFDVTNPAALTKVQTTHLEGQLIASRSIQNRARLILNTTFGQRIQQKFPAPGPVNDAKSVAKAIAANKKVIAAAPASDWLPRRFIETANGSAGPIETVLPCSQVGRPADQSGLGLTWVATVDLDVPGATNVVRGSAGVIANAGVTYASPDTLYVSTTRYSGGRQANGKTTSEVHAFSMLANDGARWIASGRFNGYLLNQFSMSEYDGALRIASTRTDAGFGGTAESGVQVMMLDAQDRKKLKVVGEVWGLGTNEQIFAVRFVGPTGYVVTYRQVDPLYVLDLADRQVPKVVGELKIPGFSTYLHPIGDGLMLGIGQNANNQGPQAQLALFDVKDPAAPKQLSTLAIGNSSSAQYDHLAFLWWPASRDVFLPTANYQTQTGYPSFGVNVARVGDRAASTLTSRGFVTHDTTSPQGPGPGPAIVTTIPGGATPPAPATPPTPSVFFQPLPILRTLIVAGKVVTVSNGGLMVSDLTSLSETNWVSFSTN
jgi:uncharacterized secreted protein with C-terminal beta-propeller domain